MSSDFKSEFSCNRLEMLACCRCNCIGTGMFLHLERSRNKRFPLPLTGSGRSLVKHCAYILCHYQLTPLAVKTFDLPISHRNDRRLFDNHCQIIRIIHGSSLLL